MKYAIANYRAFTKGSYRAVIFLVIPAIALIFTMAALFLNPFYSIGVENYWKKGILVAVYMFLIFFDIMSEYWFLGGFYTKNNSSLEFLQTGNCFQKIIRNIVIVNLVRRLIVYAGLYMLVIFVKKNSGLSIPVFSPGVFYPLCGFVISQAAIVVVRHFTMLWQGYSVAVAAEFIAIFVMIIGMRLKLDGIVWIDLILAVLAVFLEIGTVVYSLKKVRESYYDK